LEIISGGSPTGAQAAAILSAIETVIAAEATTSRDPLPDAYRSSWRRAGIESGRWRSGTRASSWGS
jgi:hypothetical protein